MYFLFLTLLAITQIHGQAQERPFILVKSSERNQILEKIDKQDMGKRYL